MVTDCIKQVFSRDEISLGKIVNYASRALTQIPVELTLAPLVEQLHLGFNKLEVLNKKFFRLPLLSVLNLDQNVLVDIPKEFKHFSGLTILSLKVTTSARPISFPSNHGCACFRITGSRPSIQISAV
jgi:Leucine-rich repeat (LRR) protein